MAIMRYALIGNEVRHVDEAESGADYRCIGCGRPVFPRNKGKIREHHFAHKHEGDRRSDCEGAFAGGGGEGFRHAFAKRLALGLSEIAVPPLFCEPDNRSGYLFVSKRPPFRLAAAGGEAEKTLPKTGIRPDVLLSLSGGGPASEWFRERFGDLLAVEIMDTHKTDARKRECYAQEGIPAVEIDISDVDWDLPLEDLKRELFLSASHSEWAWLPGGRLIPRLAEEAAAMAGEASLRLSAGSSCPIGRGPVPEGSECLTCRLMLAKGEGNPPETLCLAGAERTEAFRKSYAAARRSDLQPPVEVSLNSFGARSAPEGADPLSPAFERLRRAILERGLPSGGAWGKAMEAAAPGLRLFLRESRGRDAFGRALKSERIKAVSEDGLSLAAERTSRTGAPGEPEDSEVRLSGGREGAEAPLGREEAGAALLELAEKASRVPPVRKPSARPPGRQERPLARFRRAEAASGGAAGLSRAERG